VRTQTGPLVRHQTVALALGLLLTRAGGAVADTYYVAPDGSLPDIGLRPTQRSHLVDAGTEVGLPYHGSAPDLGAFEVVR